MKTIFAMLLFVSVSFSQGFDEVKDLADEIISSLKTSDFEILEKCQPPIETLYEIAVSMGAEIDKEKFLSEEPYIFSKLKDSHEFIINSAKENNIDLTSIQISEIIIHEKDAPNEFVLPATITFLYAENKAELVITIFAFNNKYYVSEFLMPTKVFPDNSENKKDEK